MTITGMLIEHLPWLSAKTEQAQNGDQVLIVHRSQVLRDTDPVYRPVSEFLASNGHEQLAEAIYEDEQIMFGRGVVTIYKLV